MRGASCLVILIGLFTVRPAGACSIPVFRYALENWTPSKYELVVFHKEYFSSDDQKRIKTIGDQSANANLRLNTIDLTANLEPNIRKIWEKLPKDTQLPFAVLRYPEANEKTPHVWSGPLSSPILEGLILSPGRSKLFERLTLGDTAVVLLLLSGDATADQAARDFLAKQIPSIAANIKLPEQSKEGPQIKSALPLKIRFNVVEVSRDGPEAMLAAMLLNSEDGLSDVKGPIAFPVYGRGRALCSLHGTDLVKPDELQKSLEYVCRACSCQVKELNPGVDLVIQGDWEDIFDIQPGPAPRIGPDAPIPTIEVGPTPRIVEKDQTPGITQRPAPKTPFVAEGRTPPPGNFQAVEIKRTNDAIESRPNNKTWMLAGSIGLVILSGVWVWRSRSSSKISG